MYLLRLLAFPLSVLYAMAVHIRNFLYDIGLFRSQRFATPTICIGNLNVGGSGKTPMTEYLIELLKKDYLLAVLSRGYRRKSKGFLLADIRSTVEDVGDEPYQMHKKFPKVTIAVDADRTRGISELEKSIKPDIILLDDAFQHRRVKADFSLLLTPFYQLYVDDWYLPTGNLRDAKKEAKRADVIVVTKCPHEISKHERETILKKLRPRPHQMVLFSGLAYDKKARNNGHSVDLESLRGRKVALVTGIANPKPLVTYLKEKDLEFVHLKYADHHYFSENDLEKFTEFSVVLTTEKDYGRLEGRLDNVLYLSVRHQFLRDDAKILEHRIHRFLKHCSQS